MKEMTYLQCSFCGCCRPIQYGGREVRFDKVDPENIKPFQVCRLSGQRIGESKGGHIEIIETKTLKELPGELKNQIKIQYRKILNALY
ncbi:hypothetical protein CEE34_06890 [Candidatus Aerophobetes bacterium Ae_b3a]|nr:MAG: hypothetical protein CEE34_06890 [Candidatus Aerophobetes bacterium Ae_b3a]